MGDFFGLLPLLSSQGSRLPVGLYGLGGGSGARVIASLFPQAVVHGWELDPAVVLAASHMGLGELLESGRVVAHAADALCESAVPEEGLFAALGLDIFIGESLPPEFNEPSTWQSIWSRVAPGGCMIICLADHPDEQQQGLARESSHALRSLVEAVGSDRVQLHLATSNAMALVIDAAVDWDGIRAAAPELERLTHD